MGTTAQKLQKILDSKDALKVSINNKGGSITDDTPFDEYATQVDNLPSGETDNSLLISILGKTITEVNDDVFKDYDMFSIKEYTFAYCSELHTLSLGNNTPIQNIQDRAFLQCSKLVNVNIPNVTYIGSSAFEGCVSIESIDLTNVNTFGSAVFNGCDNLKNVVIGNKTKNLPYTLFKGCKSLQSIFIPKNIEYISSQCFIYCNSLSQVNFEEGSNLLDVGSLAFSDCTNLQQIIFKGVIPPTFGSTVFRNCNALQEIRVPSESVEAYKTALGTTYADLVVADE